jgi:hypothetical protein
VYRCEDNSPVRLQWLVDRHKEDLGEFFAFVESDIYVYDSEKGWLQTLLDHMRELPDLFLVGSLVDKSDFMELEDAKRRFPEIPDDQLEFLVRIKNPERLPYDTKAPLIEPHNPPGRLLLFRTEMLNYVPIQTDGKMYASLKALRLSCLISTRVVHRHLSMLNIYDYWDYDHRQRQAFFGAMDAAAEAPESSFSPGFGSELPFDPAAGEVRNELLRARGPEALADLEEFLFETPPGSRYPRYVEGLLRLRPDVRTEFEARGLPSILGWMATDGVAQIGLEPDLIRIAAERAGVRIEALGAGGQGPVKRLKSLLGRLGRRHP